MDRKKIFRYFPVSKRDREWGCYALTAGVTTTPPHTSYPSRGHPRGHYFDWDKGRVLSEFALIYIAEGRGTFETADLSPRSVDCGSVLFLFPDVWHRYQPDQETGWTEFWVGFDGVQPRALLRHRFFSPKQALIRPIDEPAVSAIFRSLVLSIQQDSPALQQVIAGITMHLLGLLFSESKRTATSIRRKTDAVSSALDCIRRGACPPKELPRHLGVSPRKFRRDFRQHTGLSPHQYHLQLRLAEARRMLADPGLSVKEVAAACGFDDEQYFCRLFKRKTGMTSTQWRRQASLASEEFART